MKTADLEYSNLLPILLKHTNIISVGKCNFPRPCSKSKTLTQLFFTEHRTQNNAAPTIASLVIFNEYINLAGTSEA